MAVSQEDWEVPISRILYDWLRMILRAVEIFHLAWDIFFSKHFVCIMALPRQITAT